MYEVGEADGRGFIAMQYLDGDTLANRLKEAPLELPAAISIGAQVANALAEAHRNGIVHRDVKPQNVMLSAANHATVLDFGLAKTAMPGDAVSETESALTAAGVVSGTLLYMSPEQARAEIVDERSDVFSFGIVLYELVTRVHPFAHDSWAETLAAMLHREPRPIAVAIPSELRRILRKCLDKDKARRYQSMRDVAIDLENLAQEISNPGTDALPPATASAPRGPRRRTAWIATALVLALGAVVAAIIWWNACEARARRSPAMKRSPSSPILRRHRRCPPDGRMVTFIRGRNVVLDERRARFT